MANRAYLYSNNSIEVAHLRGLPQSHYYDSRWTIPIGWFFLFLPDDMRYQEMRFRGSSWQELKFVTSKEKAIQSFTYRIHRLQALVDNRLALEQFEVFINTIADWQGEIIILDPEEIFFDYEPKGGNEAACKRILNTIKNTRTS